MVAAYLVLEEPVRQARYEAQMNLKIAMIDPLLQYKSIHVTVLQIPSKIAHTFDKFYLLRSSPGSAPLALSPAELSVSDMAIDSASDGNVNDQSDNDPN